MEPSESNLSQRETSGTHRKKNMPQYDFGAHFHQRDDTPINYSVRKDHNRLHDIAYLASYIHEATFSLSQLKHDREKGDIVLSMNRIRWELLRDSNQLSDIQSRLVVSHVRNYTVELHNAPNSGRKKCEIRDFCLFENSIFILTTFDPLKMIIELSPGSDIRLQDN